MTPRGFRDELSGCKLGNRRWIEASKGLVVYKSFGGKGLEV